MIKKIIIFLMLIIVSANVFAYTTNTINITSSYANSSGNINFTGTATGELNEQLQLNVSSGGDGVGIDFNVTIVSGNFSGSFNIAIDGESSSGTVPTIKTNSFDTIRLKDKQNSDKNDTIIVDSVKPTNSAALTISVLGDNYLNYYSGSINVSYVPGTLSDSGSSGISNHIITVVPVTEINNYLSSTRKFINASTDNNKTINSLSPVIPDGNYFVVIDANDLAGNYSLSDSVLATKKNVYFDNTKPEISAVLIGTTEKTIDTNKIYIPNTSFILTILLEDSSGIEQTSSLTVIRPDALPRYSNYDATNGFVISSTDIGSGWEDGDIFRVSIDANDNVNNRYTYDFNIIIDTAKPTTPNRNTTTIEDLDKNVTITWAKDASTDVGSELKEYRVYKSTTTFTTITNQTLVCTTGTTTYTCKDTDEKNLDEVYYYGLVGVDNAGNISDSNTQSIWTGPECDIEINDGNEYTNLSSVDINISYSDDVNLVAFSCNGTSFSSYQELDEDDDEASKTFTITSGNGCNSDEDEKTIYARIKTTDEDDPRTTICSAEIYYDTTAPNIPTNIKAITQANGSIKLSWDDSEDENTDSYVTYRVYYSLTNNVTSTSSYFEVEDNTYTHNPNQDTNVYYKLSAIDEAGNQSSLSATITGVAKKIGADLTISITPSNTDANILYVGSGIKTIKYISDESLVGTPQVSVKQGTDSFVTIITTYNNSNKTGQGEFNFTKSGNGTIKIIATNNNNEISTSELSFTIDINAPTFDYNYSDSNGTFLFNLKDYSSDIHRAQYLLDDSEEICLKNKTDSNFNCIFDSTGTADGNHLVSIIVYDRALNITKKETSIVIDNVDEDQILSTTLKLELDVNIEKTKDNLELFEALNLLKELDSSIKTKFELAKADKSDGDQLFGQSKFLEAKEKYLLVKDSLIEIDNNLPKIEIINTTETDAIYDENSTVPQGLIMDSNAITDTINLYKTKDIKIIRNFDVIKIENHKFFSVTLKITNSGTTSKQITVMEEIPKSFSTSIKNLSFTEQIDILLADPIIKYSVEIPAGQTKEITYRLMTPITDVDSITRYNTINKSFVAPVILSGAIQKEKFNIKKPVNTNLFIYLISIVVLFIIILLILNAITTFKNKQVKIEIKKDSKTEMSDYLGNIKQENVKNEELEETAKIVDEKKQSADKFQENYDYILSAIKKR